MKKPQAQYQTLLKTAIVTFIVMAILLYAPSPFVVIKPGLAVSTGSFISTQHRTNEGDTGQKKGEFLLTAVLMDAPNMWNSLLSLVNSNLTVMWKHNVLGGNTVEQYAERATLIMQGSHDYAIEAAYKYLQIPYQNEPQELYVNESGSSVLNLSGDHLRSGDHIEGIYEDDILLPVASVADVADWLEQHDKIKEIELQVNRFSESLRLKLKLQPDQKLANQDSNVAARFGVASFTELRNIVPEDKEYQVKLDSSSIGGPSAGLVLTLSIIDQLTDGDLTKGTIIAVTGTINSEGQVGAIGGIKQKVVSTSEKGAQLFIVPKGNESDARKKVRKLHSNMEIVGVSSLAEAIDVIASLQVR